MSKKLLIGIGLGAVAVGAAVVINKSIKSTKVNVKDILNGTDDDDDEFYGVDESDNDEDDDILGITEDYLWDDIDDDDDDEDDEDEDEDDDYDNSDLDDILSADEYDEDDEEDDDEEDDEITRPIFNPTGFYKDGKKIDLSDSSIDKEVSSLLTNTIENSLIDNDEDEDDENADIDKYLDTLVAIGIISRDPDMILDIAFDPETGIFKCENNGVVVVMPSYDSDEYEFIADFSNCKLYGYKLKDDDYDKNMIMKNSQKETFTTERLSYKVNEEFLNQLRNSSEQENNDVQIIKCFDMEFLNDKKNALSETGKTSLCERTSFILNATYNMQEEIREKYNI